MAMRRSLALALLCLVGLAVLNVSQAQDSPQDYLSVHTAARAEVGVEPMTWDDGVAAYAQNYANQMASSCNLVHSSGPYGENLAWSSDSRLSSTEFKNIGHGL
ncbi:hypothetical protein IFM89_004532 [Coptis chinensis]|uniref:SCP domain-containing protein n=1 Tax=Coptis chinensis TaxID=261450 RepID=A0A835GWC2_9MAGN|nr:hypothetical protein IFM89_004532 [Coptis chinensis]